MRPSFARLRTELLAQTERSVEQLAGLSGLTIANASQHLQQLRRAGLVEGRREGKRVIYCLADAEI
jgi:DNA-binding transcriptional ArsR family regulator